MNRRTQTIAIVPLLLVVSCVDPYRPPVENSAVDKFLVVDGFLDVAAGKATVQLSRSVPLSEVKENPKESNATVTVDVANGSSLELNETSAGVYELDGLDIDPGTQYRLRVQTGNGSRYSSDFISLKKSPEIDSLVWEAEDDGIHFYVNSHDDAGQVLYYRYRFTEIWQYRVPIVSHYKKVGLKPVLRKRNEFVDTCWSQAISTEILLKSTKRLSRDVVSMLPIHFVPKGSRKFEILYSLSIEQRAISEEEYNFWELMRKTTQSVGSLFDPTPSAVLGNVHNDDDAAQPVLGYFSGGFSSIKRSFITFDDLPKDLQFLDPSGYECGLFQYLASNADGFGSNIWVELADPSIDLYYAASAVCADCRTHGGDTIRPKFWPE